METSKELSNKARSNQRRMVSRNKFVKKALVFPPLLASPGSSCHMKQDTGERET